MVFFSTIELPEPLRREITEGGGRVRDGVDLLKARLDYRPITIGAMLRAAELWAITRQARTPTAHPDALDGDCILAAQAQVEAGPGSVPVVATTNLAHFLRFPEVVARVWDAIA